MTRARILMQMHVSFLKSKTRALWYLGVSDDADSESGVFILHVFAYFGQKFRQIFRKRMKY